MLPLAESCLLKKIELPRWMACATLSAAKVRLTWASVSLLSDAAFFCWTDIRSRKCS